MIYLNVRPLLGTTPQWYIAAQCYQDQDTLSSISCINITVHRYVTVTTSYSLPYITVTVNSVTSPLFYISNKYQHKTRKYQGRQGRSFSNDFFPFGLKKQSPFVVWSLCPYNVTPTDSHSVSHTLWTWQKIFQCSQPPATTTPPPSLPSIPSLPSMLWATTKTHVLCFILSVIFHREVYIIMTSA